MSEAKDYQKKESRYREKIIIMQFKPLDAAKLEAKQRQLLDFHTQRLIFPFKGEIIMGCRKSQSPVKTSFPRSIISLPVLLVPWGYLKGAERRACDPGQTNWTFFPGRLHLFIPS